MRSLGLATDLLALLGIAEIERHPDHIVVRTPDQPDFWSGNLIVSLGAPLTAEEEVARFRAAFPEASHVTVAWDDPHLDPGPMRGAWEALGAEVGADDVLAREGPPHPAPCPTATRSANWTPTRTTTGPSPCAWR